jgi:hypothetical protein
VSNGRRVKRRPPDPDAVEEAFRAELAKGCPGCGSRTVSGKFRGRWEWTLHCKPDCPSWTGREFTGHTIGAEAAKRAGMRYQAIDGTSGGVVVAAQPG